MSLVGREQERERLAAVAAAGGSLLIVGEPGAGKSALLSCLADHLTNKPGTGYRDRFTGPYEHRILDGIGHNVPQEAPEAFTRAVLDASR